MGVLLVSQTIGLVVIGGFAAVRAEPHPGAEFALYSALGGLAGLLGITAFYRGLAVGAMGVVAPISGVAAAIPVTVGIASGERPSAAQAAGIGLALAGIALASREPQSAGPRARVAGGVGLALLSALGFGTFFVLIARASEGDATWAILTSRVVGLTVLGAVAVALRPRFEPGRADVPALVAIGLFDIVGQALFAVATTLGLLSVVSVLASLYPVTTIVLARAVLGERVSALQRGGAVGALAGVVLITAG